MRTNALLSVKVPAEAKVFVNDRLTSSVGADREYISRDLQPGAHYNYDVRAEFVRDGQTVTESKTIQLVAGQTANLDFSFAEANAQTAANVDTRTTLVVRVPADAKLFLAGQEMKATGPVREFATTKLPSGAQWASYTIRAVVEHDGQQQVSEQTVSLQAGESREVSINFEGQATEKVATKTSR
jgi:uncharacterized protein (TIGR03000 family)